MDWLAHQFQSRHHQHPTAEVRQTFGLPEGDEQIVQDQPQGTGETDWTSDVVDSNFSFDEDSDSLPVPRPVHHSSDTFFR